MGGKPPILKMLFFLNLISVFLIVLFVIKFDRKMIFFGLQFAFFIIFQYLSTIITLMKIM